MRTASKYSEVEAKFVVPKPMIGPQPSLPVNASNFARTALEAFNARYNTKERFAYGEDVFYTNLFKEVIRHRTDGEKNTSVLTVKERKSGNHITDRHEVDLFIREDQDPHRVQTFLERTGWTKTMRLFKYSCVLHPIDPSEAWCVAAYAVMPTRKDKPEAWFLEVEIERGSLREKRRLLNQWIRALKPAFGDPVNSSLYELYKDNPRYMINNGGR